MSGGGFDVVILGAGAAGMFCAAQAARRGRRTLVLDHAKRPGEKIRISGGGRCNFTNLRCRPEAFLSENPRFCVSALSRYDQHDFIRLVEAHGIAFHEKTLGQLFCDGRSTEIVDMLRAEMGDAGASLRLSEAIGDVAPVDGGWSLRSSRGRIETESLVVATGGKSIPKMGATGFAYDLARRFGLAVTETRPALVPFTLSRELLQKFRPLVGVAADVTAEAGGAAFDEAMLFTHRGLSGPAMLQVSSYWREGDAVRIAFGGADALFGALRAERAANGRRALSTALATVLPKALARLLGDEMEPKRNIADLSDKRMREIAGALAAYQIRPIGTEGYRKAEVTRGGVATEGLDGRTMQAKAATGLYMIGEAVDVTGWLGGYNFQWAWSSAAAAGEAC